MDTKSLIKLAKEVTDDRQLTHDNTAGGVGATIITDTGNIYRGVCIDTGSSMGFCAEHAAIATMVTADETRIKTVVAVWQDRRDGKWYVLPPCGRCREFMKQIDETNLDADVILGCDNVVKLRELLPYNEWPSPLPESD
jgi:cytidine deaminase